MEKRSNCAIAENRTFVVRHISDRLYSMGFEIIALFCGPHNKEPEHNKNRKKNWSVSPTPPPPPNSRNFFNAVARLQIFF